MENEKDGASVKRIEDLTPEELEQLSDEEYDKLEEESDARMRSIEVADLEAQQHEIWACKIGDVLEITVPFEVQDWDDEKEAPTPPMPVFVGQIYRAADRKGRGWDLELVPGEGVKGAQYVRLMNWEILDYCKLLPSPT